MIFSYPYNPLYCDKQPSRNHTEPFCRHSPTTKSFGPLRGGFLYIPREFAAGPPACNSSYPHLENCISRLDLDTVPRPRTKCGRAGQRRCNTGAGTQIRCKRRPQARDTSIGTCALPALETEIQFEICIFVLDEKAISKYRPVATISKFEIASHIPVVLVGECLPQTLLLFLTVCACSIYV